MSTVHLNNLISMVLDPIALASKDSEEVISSEESLARIDEANIEIVKEAMEESDETIRGGRPFPGGGGGYRGV